MEHELHLLQPTLIILAAAIVVVPLFRRLRITPVLGYLLAGLLIGPHALGLVRELEVIETLAEFGVEASGEADGRRAMARVIEEMKKRASDSLHANFERMGPPCSSSSIRIP